MTPTQIAVAAAAVLFLLYLVIQVRPLGTVRAGSAEDVAEARKRARAAKTPEERASALADAGEASASRGRLRAAVGLFLRAMRADPRSAVIVRRVATALASRPEMLERLLLRRVAASSADTDESDPALEAAVHALEGVWTQRRARGLARLAGRFLAHERKRSGDQ